MSTSLAVAVCRHCKKERNAKPDKTGGVKLPIGWKREAGEAACGECWKQRYILRALTFPVAEPLSGSWKDLEGDLRQMWIQTTAAVNWMTTECYIRDVRRNGEEKMPPMPHLYLYPEARARFPGIPPQSVVALERTTQRKYRARRYDVIWTAAASLPTARYPQPFPVHNQAWKFAFNDQNQPIVECRIGASSWKLRLKSGARYWRQIAGLRHMTERGEMAIYKAGDGTILVKLVGWLTRGETKKRTNALVVRTGKDHLLSALDLDGQRVWVENRDDLPGIIAAHRNRLQRLSEDQKAEQRPVPSFANVRSKAARQYRDRMKSTIQEVCAHLTAFAVRRRFGKVLYDDTERWLNPFPYFELGERLRTALDEHGIEFEKIEGASGEATAEEQGPLAEE